MEQALNLSWELSRFAEAGPLGTRLIVMTRLTARPIESSARAPLNVSLVLDRSGSMSGAKMENCRHAARFGVSQLAPTDQCSVVTFTTDVQVLAPHGPVRDKPAIMQRIGEIRASGSTNLSGGWLQGAALVEKAMAPGQINRVVLLTDGRATDGLTSSEQLQGLAQELQGKGIQTTTVGFGADFDEDLLRGMADAGGGNFHFIESPEEAPTVFAREFAELLAIVAQNVRLRVIPADGVSTVTLMQDLPVEGVAGGLEVSLGDLFAGDERNILLELRLPPGASPQGITVLQLSYQQVVAPVAFRELSAFVESPVGSLEALPVNPVVWREVLLSRVSSQLKEARQEADAGRMDQAKQRLQETRQALDTSDYRDDPVFQEKSYELKRLEGLMEDDYHGAGRKSMSAYEGLSAKEKFYAKGGLLDPGVRKRLLASRSVVFLTSRDLAVGAGLPDATVSPFEGLPFSALARAAQTSEQAAQQWRWIESRQRAVEALWPSSPGGPLKPGAHQLLSAFQYRWPATAIVTTATDGLHLRVATMEVVELFGSLWRGRCGECEQPSDLANLARRDGIPLGHCGHPLRPDVVWPGEKLPAAALERAKQLCSQADAIVVIGAAGEQVILSQLLTLSQGQVLALCPGEAPDWADGHIRGIAEVGLRLLARETSTTLP